MAAVSQVMRLGDHVIDGLERRAGAVEFCQFVRKSQALIGELSLLDAQSVLEDGLLVPSDDVLFELVVAFDVIDALVEAGFRVAAEGLAIVETGSRRPLATLSCGARTARVWWQRSPRTVGVASTSRYSAIRLAHGLSASSLRPDVLLHLSEADGLLLFEVKQTSVGDDRVRQSLLDALAYLYDFQDDLRDRPRPWGVAVAWGAKATRPTDVRKLDLLITNEDTVKDTDRSAVHAWDGP
jgi:hypothetical protein